MRYAALIVVVVAVLLTSISFSGRSFASHEHYLLTPGVCVEDIASGQTSKDEGEGGYHAYHDHIHRWQPGTVAFDNENNPVSLDKGSCPAPR